MVLPANHTLETSVCTHFLEDPVALSTDLLFWKLEVGSVAPASPQAHAGFLDILCGYLPSVIYINL